MMREPRSAPTDRVRADKLEGWPAVVITDAHGVVTYWSAMAERVYGWSATEAVGRSILELAVERPDVHVAPDIATAMASGGPWEGRFSVHAKDGTTFDVWAIDEPLRGPTGEVVGMVGLSVPAADLVAPDEDRLLAAEQLVRRARGRAEAAAERLDRLQQIAAALSRLRSADEVAEVVLNEVAPELGGATRAMWLLDETRPVLRLARASENPRAAEFAEMPVDADLPGASVVRTGQPVFVTSRAERNRLYPSLTSVERDASFAVLPLATDGRVAGILAVGFDNDHAFDPDERRFLTAVADLAAQAMERGRLHATELQGAARLAFLAEASETLATSLDYHETLSHVVRLMVPRVADMATVHLYDDHGVLHRVALAHRDPDSEAAMLAYTAGRGSEIHNVPLDTTAHQGRTIRDVTPAVIERVAMDTDHARLLEKLHITSNITAPLVGRGETLGVLNFMRVGDSPPYRSEDQSLAEELARRAAVAIDNARLHAARAEVARLLQASLLPPRLPEVPHVDLAAAYHPAGQGVEAGGDFYDLWSLPRERWAVMIGDVCGTGPAAAALTAQVRHTARAIAGTGAGASEVVATVNDALAASIEEEKFCTMVMAVLTRVAADGVELDLVCAGHPCPLIVRAGGEVDELLPAGGLVGVFPGARHASIPVRLGPGDTLVLYTDGVTEARSADPGENGARGFFETEHLAALVSSLAGQPSSVMVSAIEDNLMAFAGGRLVDDVAILALRSSPPS